MTKDYTPRWNCDPTNPSNLGIWAKDQLYLGKGRLKFVALDKPESFRGGKPNWKLSFCVGDEAAVESLNDLVGHTEGWLQTAYQEDLAKVKGPARKKRQEAGCPVLPTKENYRYEGEGDDRDLVPDGTYYVSCVAAAKEIVTSKAKYNLRPTVYKRLPSGKIMKLHPRHCGGLDGAEAEVWVRPRLVWLDDKGRYSIQLQPTSVVLHSIPTQQTEDDTPPGYELDNSPQAGDGSGYTEEDEHHEEDDYEEAAVPPNDAPEDEPSF